MRTSMKRTASFLIPLALAISTVSAHAETIQIASAAVWATFAT